MIVTMMIMAIMMVVPILMIMILILSLLLSQYCPATVLILSLRLPYYCLSAALSPPTPAGPCPTLSAVPRRRSGASSAGSSIVITVIVETIDGGSRGATINRGEWGPLSLLSSLLVIVVSSG